MRNPGPFAGTVLRHFPFCRISPLNSAAGGSGRARGSSQAGTDPKYPRTLRFSPKHHTAIPPALQGWPPKTAPWGHFWGGAACWRPAPGADGQRAPPPDWLHLRWCHHGASSRPAVPPPCRTDTRPTRPHHCHGSGNCHRPPGHLLPLSPPDPRARFPGAGGTGRFPKRVVAKE